jgi:antitoxin MazE
MKARLVRIGNSRGVRLPKALIEQAGLTDEVDVSLQDGAVVIRSNAHPRAGWATSAAALRAAGEDQLLDEPEATRFDATEWRW